MLFLTALAILLGSTGLSVWLLFSNYQNIQLLRQAEKNFRSGDSAALLAAEKQLLQLIKNDDDNEQAFILLGKIAAQKKICPEEIYYCYQAHKLNPLSKENEKRYIQSLLHAREFERLENVLSIKTDLSQEYKNILLYAAGQNGHTSKYVQVSADKNGKNFLADLGKLLFKDRLTTPENKLAALDKMLLKADDFQKQEIFAAQAQIYLAQNNIAKAEAPLRKAWQLNEFAFGPVLGRYYANYRSFALALPVFEKYLQTYHDPETALQYAEICCLLKKTDVFAKLRTQYQDDPGEGGMLFNYYLNILEAFCSGDFKAMTPYLSPVEKTVKTPLATFIYLCTALDKDNLPDIQKYAALLWEQRPYLDLQKRADQLILALIRRKAVQPGKELELLAELAPKVYRRTQDVLAGKFLLLSQRQKGSLDVLLLNDLLKRFPNDRGVSKIAVEYYLLHDPAVAQKLMEQYAKNHPAHQKDMLLYRISLAWRTKDLNRASQLFQQNFQPGLTAFYWSFAINNRRKDDLIFLSREQKYRPFCQAALLLLEGKKQQALDLLARADARKDLDLLFYAAKTLGENNRPQEALEKYAQFPENTSYQLEVKLNSAELNWELGRKNQSLLQARQAYMQAPERVEAQFCYADKLFRMGHHEEVAEVLNHILPGPYSIPMRKILISSLETLLKESIPERDAQRIRTLSERLLHHAPGNKTALEYRKKLSLQSDKIRTGEKK